MRIWQTSLILLALFCVAVFAQQKGTFTDSRDGKNYKTVKIGKQTWMAENLNYNEKSSKCYDNKPANCIKYGRLYDWNMAKKACPKGWHLPSDSEWDKLMRYVDGDTGMESPYDSKTAGKYLKATSGWNDFKGKSGKGEDKFGFSALPGGYGDSFGYFYHVGIGGNWWSSSMGSSLAAYSWDISYSYECLISDNDDEFYLHSVRCLQD
jgi:uncharacterized protein (TIGR02145 family)